MLPKWAARSGTVRRIHAGRPRPARRGRPGGGWTHNSVMQTYRSPRWALVIQTILLAFMALIALSIAIQPNAGRPGTAPGYIAFGTALAASIIFVAVGQIRSRLVVTELGLSWRYVMRTRSVPWTDIQDVLAVPAASHGPYYSPGIKVGGKLVRINSVVGPRRYTERIVAAICAARQELGAALPPAPGGPSAAGG